jgi:hypothetical protein
MSAKLQKSKNFYSPAEVSILIQHVVRQSQFEFPSKLEAMVHACIQGFYIASLKSYNTRIER